MEQHRNASRAEAKDQYDAAKEAMEAMVHVSIVEIIRIGAFPGQEGRQQQNGCQINGIALFEGFAEQEIDDPDNELYEIDHKDQRRDIDEFGGKVAGIAPIEDIKKQAYHGVDDPDEEAGHHSGPKN